MPRLERSNFERAIWPTVVGVGSIPAAFVAYRWVLPWGLSWQQPELFACAWLAAIAALTLALVYKGRFESWANRTNPLAWSALFVLLVLGTVGMGRAGTLHSQNCWTIQRSGSTTIYGCAPGNNEPPDAKATSDENHDAPICDTNGEDRTGATVWICTG